MPPVHSIHIVGGTGANTVYKDLLAQLTSQSPPVTIVHAMPTGFAEPFSHRLAQTCPVPVHCITKTTTLEAGNVYVIPSEFHPQLSLTKTFDITLSQRALDANAWAASIGSTARKHSMIIVLSGADDSDLAGFKLAFTQGTTIYAQEPKTAPSPQLIEKLNTAGCLKSMATAQSLGESIGFLNASIDTK